MVGELPSPEILINVFPSVPRVGVSGAGLYFLPEERSTFIHAYVMLLFLHRVLQCS